MKICLNRLRALAIILVSPLFLESAAAAEDAASNHLLSSSATLEVEVADPSGELPEDLVAEDLEIFLEGRSLDLAIASQGEEKRPWRLVIYIDQLLISPGALSRGALLLAGHARRFAELGEVEIVSADPEPHRILPPSRDPAAIEAALSLTSLKAAEQDSIRGLRKRAFQQISHLRGRPEAGNTSSEMSSIVQEAIDTEARLVTRQQDYLLSWLAANRQPGERRALLWVTDGFDLEPREFYLRQLPSTQADLVKSSTTSAALQAVAVEAGRTVAALGWTSLIFSPEPLGEAVNATEREFDRFRESGGDGNQRGPSGGYKTSMEELRRRLRGDAVEPEPKGPLLLAPKAPLEMLADDTGGDLVRQPRALEAALDSLDRRITLTVAVPDRHLHSISIRSDRSGLRARGPRWLGLDLPESLSAGRARRLLAGDLEGGDLDLASALRLEPEAAGVSRATLEIQAELPLRDSPPGETEGEPQRGKTGESNPASDPEKSIAPDGPNHREQVADQAIAASDAISPPTVVRITLAQGDRSGPSQLQHLYETVDNPADGIRFQAPVEVAAGIERVAIVVEVLGSGVWGGTLAAVVAAAEDATKVSDGTNSEADEAREDALSAALAEAAFLPRPKAIRLIDPGSELLRGKVRFRTLVQAQGVTKVSFFLDGELVATRNRPPFDTKIDLGRFPRARTLRAVAYGEDGKELSSDVLALNDVSGGFRVRITSPEPGRQRGVVDVEMDLSVPLEHRLDRLELSWNERRIATLFSPPFRHRMVIPTDQPGGFIRAVATLDDGRTTEDVVFLNERDFADQLQVRLVELYTVVTDRKGRPTEGLEQESFVIREEGVEQEIVSFDDAGDLPLTLGLNIDSSASMFVKLPAVQQAAGDFVRGFLSGRDQAFLVDFDTQPRMARELTSNLRSVVSSIDSLEADGDTHIWESIVFSLVELQSVQGKKAVVVFSDGAQEEEALSFKVCYDFSQRLGVPIYIIVLHPGVARGDELTSSMKGFTRKLDRLTEATGGRTYYIPNTDNLDTIYQQIDTELRSQYLLTYYASASEGTPAWRKIEVEIKKKGLRARTISGYFPRW